VSGGIFSTHFVHENVSRIGELCGNPAGRVFRQIAAGLIQSDDQLAAEADVCPVTHASGKSRGVIFRWACNHRLRAGITCFADNSRHSSGWAAQISMPSFASDHDWRKGRGHGAEYGNLTIVGRDAGFGALYVAKAMRSAAPMGASTAFRNLLRQGWLKGPPRMRPRPHRARDAGDNHGSCAG